LSVTPGMRTFSASSLTEQAIFCYPFPALNEIDLKFLRMAVELAWEGLGVNSPNPLVGCVIVQNGEVTGRGVHIFGKKSHAEAKALQDAGDNARGAILYVNLEPCNHHGRTPPCSEAIIEAGISRVVYGINDPNREVRGDGALHLASNGVSVEKCNDVGLIMEMEEQNRFFFTHKRRSRPYITYKVAASMDGRIATRKGHSKWITHPQALSVAHLLRGVYDAILVGSRTAREDNPMLTYRPDKNGTIEMPEILFPHTPSKLESPLRIVLDDGLSLPASVQLFNTETAETIVITGEDASSERIGELSEMGVEVITVPRESGNLDLNAAMLALASKGIQSLLIEGGGETAGRFFDMDLLDEVNIFLSPILIGGRDAVPILGGEGVGRLLDAKQLGNMRTGFVDPDLLVVGRILRDL